MSANHELTTDRPLFQSGDHVMQDIASGTGSDYIADCLGSAEWAARISACVNFLAGIPSDKLDGTLLERLLAVERERDEAMAALRFYADPQRYQGPNRRREEDDEFTPEDAPYRLDVTRDNGNIARTVIAKAQR